MSMKNSNNTNGNRTRHPPACRAMPQSPRAPGTTITLANTFLVPLSFSDTSFHWKIHFVFFFLLFFCEGQTAYIEVQKICLIPSLRSLLEFDLPEIKWYSRVSLCVPTDPNCSIVQCKPLTWRQNMKLQKGIGVL